MNALNGTESKETKLTQSYMDYAFPLHNGDAVKVCYIHQRHLPNAKQRNSQYGDNSFDFIVGISYYIINRGKYYFKVYHRPYQTAFGTGKKLAAGDINALQKSDSKDEIADLTNSLINLAHIRKQSSDQAKAKKLRLKPFFKI